METKLERIADKSAHEAKAEFTSLYHLLNEELLTQCHRELDFRKARGVDDVSKKEYEENLKSNIENLVHRLKNKSYRPQPTLRVYIPKANGKKRPLGIAAYEDKIVQLGLKKILEAVYEPKFLHNMYGFRARKSCHDAIKAMCRHIVREKINYIVDADIKGFFDHMDHQWIIRFVEYYIKDPNILGLIKKYLKAGIMEDGEYQASEEGAVQGGSISPMLANIYMHHVLMLWYKISWRKQARGGSFLVAYADDFLAGFEYRQEAEAYYKQMKERLERFGLEIESSKSRLLEFGRYAEERRKRRGEKKPETFDFLGFTFYCGRSREGKYCIIPRTNRKRLRDKLRAMKEWMKKVQNEPVREVIATLNRKLLGHNRYYGISHNGQMIKKYHFYVTLMLYRMMNRRSQKRSYTWEGFRMMLACYPLVKPKLYHNIYV